MHAILNRTSHVLRITVAVLFPLVAFATAARADIFQWEYINPADPSQGKQQSTTLAPDGAGVDAVPGADLSGRNLTMAYLIGADLTGANGDYANLTNADLSQANLTNAYFDRATLTDADFTDAEVRGANFANVLTEPGYVRRNWNHACPALLHGQLPGPRFDAGSVLAATILTGGNFAGQNLTNANFAGATLTGADFTGAEVRGANFDSTTTEPDSRWRSSTRRPATRPTT